MHNNGGEAKQQRSSKLWVVLGDYDGCLELCNVEPRISLFTSQSFKNSDKFYEGYDSIKWEYANPMLDNEEGFIKLIRRYEKHNSIKWKLNMLKEDYLSNEKVRSNLIKLWEKDENFDSNLFDKVTKCVLSFYEKLTHICLMGDLLNAGYKWGEDICIMNGSYRQSKMLDEHNANTNFNGTVRENHDKWVDKLRAYLHPLLRETTITVDKFTAYDDSDEAAGVAMTSSRSQTICQRLSQSCCGLFSSCIKPTEAINPDQSKFGLVLSQLHRRKRVNPDKDIRVLFFDDRNKKGDEHGIDQAMETIRDDSSLIPEGVKFCPIQFDSYMHLHSYHEAGPLFPSLGNNGWIVGTGPVRECGYFDSVFMSADFHAAKKALKELLLQTAEKPSRPQGFCQRLSQCCSSLFSCFGGATTNTSSPRSDTPLLDP